MGKGKAKTKDKTRLTGPGKNMANRTKSCQQDKRCPAGQNMFNGTKHVQQDKTFPI